MSEQKQNQKQKRIYLWCLPRSLSTAFSRSIATIPNSKVIVHPYMCAFFLETKPSMPKLIVDYGKTFEEVRRNLKQEFSGHDLVFIKEGTSMLGDRVDDNSYIPEDWIHTFLIRHPAKTLNSFVSMVTNGVNQGGGDEKIRQKILDEILEAEGIQREQSNSTLWKVFQKVTQTYKQKPVVVDADDLQRNPEGIFKAYCKEVGIEYRDSMIHWGPISNELKETAYLTQLSIPATAFAVDKAMNSTEFVKSDPKPGSIDDVPDKYKALVEENIPLYEKLREYRLQPETSNSK